MDAIIVLCPDPIEPEDEEDRVEAEAMIGSKEEMEIWEKGRKIGENSHLWSRGSDTKTEIEKEKLCSLCKRNKSE